MIDSSKIDSLVQQLFDAIPPGVKNMPDDMRKNFRDILQGAFHRLDLVTREEFDAQVAVLHRTREKLEALEKKLQSCESDVKK